MSEEARRVPLMPLEDGGTAIVPAGLDDALQLWLQETANERLSLRAFADILAVVLHTQGLAIVPLAFDKSNSQAVDLVVYTQALVWKRDAECRAKAAEDELAALQALFVDPAQVDSEGA